jgi:hypothetical protein
MPIELGITRPPVARTAASAAPLRVVIDKQHNEFTFPMATEPTEVLLDPGGWVSMMKATFVKQ